MMFSVQEKDSWKSWTYPFTYYEVSNFWLAMPLNIVYWFLGNWNKCIPLL